MYKEKNHGNPFQSVSLRERGKDQNPVDDTKLKLTGTKSATL